MKLLLEIYLIISQYTFLDSISYIQILGRPLLQWVKYLLLIISIIVMFYQATTNKDRESRLYNINTFVFIFVFIFLTYGNSLIRGNKIINILSESFPYIFSLTILFYLDKIKISFKEMIYLIFFMCILSGIVSIMVSIDKSTVNGLLRAATYVDGSLGVIGLCTSFYFLVNKSNFSKVLTILGFLGSLIVLILGESRGRILIAMISIIIIVFLSLDNGFKIFYKLLLVVLLVGVIYIALANSFQNEISNLLKTIESRFYRLGDDNSSAYRTYEMQIQFKLFLESFVLGKGWGIRDNYPLLNGTMYNHSMYTTILLHTGLFGIGYLIYFIKLFVKYIIKFVNEKEKLYSLIIALLFAVLSLGYGNAGIAKSGAMTGLILIYVTINLSQQDSSIIK